MIIFAIIVGVLVMIVVAIMWSAMRPSAGRQDDSWAFHAGDATHQDHQHTPHCGHDHGYTGSSDSSGDSCSDSGGGDSSSSD